MGFRGVYLVELGFVVDFLVSDDGYSSCCDI